MSAGISLRLVGLSHRSAPKGLRECMTLDAERRTRLETALDALSGLEGHLLLCTCNRVELYASGSAEEPLRQAREYFCKATGLGIAGAERYGYEKAGCDAVRHLMEVCAGLDSEMTGETEILGQVKQAYSSAAQAGRLGPLMHRLFQKSFQAAKLARELSGIGAGQVSIGAVAVELARRIHGDLSHSRIMVVGTGQVGADVAQAMRLRGAGDIRLTGRSEDKLCCVAGIAGARSIPFSVWKSHVAECDIVIFCTSAPGSIICRDEIRAAMHGRAGRPLFLMDLAMPPDVEPEAGDLDDVFLHSFSDLAAMANENMRGRLAELERCRAELEERALRLWKDILSRHDGAACEGQELSQHEDSRARQES